VSPGPTHFGALGGAEVRLAGQVRSYFKALAPGSLANHGLGIALVFNVGSAVHQGCKNSSANPNHPPACPSYASRTLPGRVTFPACDHSATSRKEQVTCTTTTATSRIPRLLRLLLELQLEGLGRIIHILVCGSYLVPIPGSCPRDRRYQRLVIHGTSHTPKHAYLVLSGSGNYML
jgi:hypothetical protein